MHSRNRLQTSFGLSFARGSVGCKGMRQRNDGVRARFAHESGTARYQDDVNRCIARIRLVRNPRLLQADFGQCYQQIAAFKRYDNLKTSVRLNLFF
jgi:hypothetical protein